MRHDLTLYNDRARRFQRTKTALEEQKGTELSDAQAVDILISEYADKTPILPD